MIWKILERIEKYKKNSKMYLKLSLELAKHIEKTQKYGIVIN